MAKPKIARTLTDLFDLMNDRLRRLELRINKAGKWTFSEDQATGHLMAVRDNGQGVASTIREIADPAGPKSIEADTAVIGTITTNRVTTAETFTQQIQIGPNNEFLVGVNFAGQLIAVSQVSPFTVTLLANP